MIMGETERRGQEDLGGGRFIANFYREECVSVMVGGGAWIIVPRCWVS